MAREKLSFGVALSGVAIAVLTTLVLFTHPAPHALTLWGIIGAAVLVSVGAVSLAKQPSSAWLRRGTVFLLGATSYLLVTQAVRAWLPIHENEGWLVWRLLSPLLLALAISQIMLILLAGESAESLAEAKEPVRK